jgi:hypothetical protein
VSTAIIGVVGLFIANRAADKHPANLLLIKTRPINDRPDRFMPILPAMLYDACRL